ncbi:hypothetical protein FSC37_11685 [Piscinibacter aquaticus]|uniref:Uncharacterized protein n=1 Tax=Piscinibacter aquaticus TaxID=392597 RepID=A0A5C6U3J8_9BURK|nr:hypothetical protein FSC37_11685 [Piscinibacter aquaticus]
MIDRIFGALLIVCLLAGGTAAISSALLEDEAPARPVLTATLPTVEIVGKRLPVETPVDTPVARNEAAAEPTARQLQ